MESEHPVALTTIARFFRSGRRRFAHDSQRVVTTFCDVNPFAVSEIRYHPSMPRDYGQLCPMALSLEILGERWTLLIVRDLLRGPRKFQDLTESLGAAPGLLSRRLKLLEERGVIARRMYTDHPPRAEYALTQRGAELRDVVRALTIWGSKHLPGERVLVHSRCDHPIEIAYRCARCDETLALADIAYRTEATVKPRKRSTRRVPPSASISTRRRRKVASAHKAIA